MAADRQIEGGFAVPADLQPDGIGLMSQEMRMTMGEQMPLTVDGPLRMVNTIRIRADAREEYLAALAEILPQARAQETCVYLEVGEVVGEPGTFVLNELWLDSRVFVEEVLALPFYQRYIERSEPLYASPREVRML